MLGVQQLASAFSLQNLLGFLFLKKANLGDIVVDSGRCMFPVPDVCVYVQQAQLDSLRTSTMEASSS